MTSKGPALKSLSPSSTLSRSFASSPLHASAGRRGSPESNDTRPDKFDCNSVDSSSSRSSSPASIVSHSDSSLFDRILCIGSPATWAAKINASTSALVTTRGLASKTQEKRQWSCNSPQNSKTKTPVGQEKPSPTPKQSYITWSQNSSLLITVSLQRESREAGNGLTCVATVLKTKKNRPFGPFFLRSIR